MSADESAIDLIAACARSYWTKGGFDAKKIVKTAENRLFDTAGARSGRWSATESAISYEKYGCKPLGVSASGYQRNSGMQLPSR